MEGQKTEWTPGPWKLFKETRNPLYQKVPKYDEGLANYSRAVQTCWYIAGPKHRSDFAADVITSSSNKGAANACLISASPDLYAELKAVEWSATEQRYCWGDYMVRACPRCSQTPEEGHAPDCRLAAALAKAEGRTQS